MKLIEQLQSRIDKTSHEISEAIALHYWNDLPKEHQKNIMADQALDKRLMGELVRKQRVENAYQKLIRMYAKALARNVKEGKVAE